MAATIFHWGLHPWAIYAVVALALAFFAYNSGLPLTIRSAFYPIFGDAVFGWVGHIIDTLAVFATLFGLATSLGIGAEQASAGLNYLFGLPATNVTKVVLIIAITAVARGSLRAGLAARGSRLAGIYRWVADRPGVFVQPAVFEAFGLTVIEAMISGLPTFATLYGGPLEIIEDGKSGFHIDPNHGDRAAERLADFWERCEEEPEYWQRISEGGIERVRSRYTWDLHAERLMTLSRVYGFWKFVTNLERQETRRYLEMFYSLQYRPRAATVGQDGA